jgi:hypothetical protein
MKAAVAVLLLLTGVTLGLATGRWVEGDEVSFLVKEQFQNKADLRLAVLEPIYAAQFSVVAVRGNLPSPGEGIECKSREVRWEIQRLTAEGKPLPKEPAADLLLDCKYLSSKEKGTLAVKGVRFRGNAVQVGF